MARTVTIGCKLPHGIVIQHPTQAGNSVELAGSNKELIINSGYGTTDVDGDLWDAWAEVHKDFPALKNGSIFFAKNNHEVKAVARELEGQETGLEPMRTDGKDKRAKGVKTADTKD